MFIYLLLARYTKCEARYRGVWSCVSQRVIQTRKATDLLLPYSLLSPRKLLAMNCDTVNTTSTRLALGDRTNVTSARVFDDRRPPCQAHRPQRAREDSQDDDTPPSSSPTQIGRSALN